MSGVTKLGIDDDAFLVESIIGRCPKTMMLREIYQNAIEAASQSEDEKLVRIDAVEVNGVRKLRVWNSGPGMNPAMLYGMCDISSSLGKSKSLDGNFGIGAKVALLPSNHHGVRYRSCTNGRAYEIMIGRRDGVYGRILRTVGSGTRTVEILDVSTDVQNSGESLAFDWTEVVLLGMTPEQDTEADPYDGSPPMNKYWVPEQLWKRYFRVPKGVRTVIGAGLQRFNAPRDFVPIMDRVAAYSRHEAVATRNGINVHFFYDPEHPERSWENKSSDDAIQSTTAMLAVCWKNELYDVQQGSQWFYDAPRYGLNFGARHISVVIELPGDYDVYPEMYREFLKYGSSTQGNVRAFDFSRLVMASRPEWVREIADANVRHEFEKETHDFFAEFGQLIKDFEFTPREHSKGEDGKELAELDPTSFAGKVFGICGVQPVLLYDPVDVRDRWLEGRAGVYYPETSQIFINMLYESLGLFNKSLREAVAESDVELEDQALPSRIAEYYYIRRLLRTLVICLSKERNPQNWQPEHILRSISPESLSAVADDMVDLLDLALAAVRRNVMAS